jgi:hypothetical protein
MTAYEILQVSHGDWSSDVCSSDLIDQSNCKEIVLRLQGRALRQNRFFTSKAHVSAFNIMLHRMLTMQIFSYLDARPDESKKANINKFRAIMGIDEDEWAYETIKKNYWRYRQKNDNKVFTVLSPK